MERQWQKQTQKLLSHHNGKTKDRSDAHDVISSDNEQHMARQKRIEKANWRAEMDTKRFILIPFPFASQYRIYQTNRLASRDERKLI